MLKRSATGWERRAPVQCTVCDRDAFVDKSTRDSQAVSEQATKRKGPTDTQRSKMIGEHQRPFAYDEIVLLMSFDDGLRRDLRLRLQASAPTGSVQEGYVKLFNDAIEADPNLKERVRKCHQAAREHHAIPIQTRIAMLAETPQRTADSHRVTVRYGSCRDRVHSDHLIILPPAQLRVGCREPVIPPAQLHYGAVEVSVSRLGQRGSPDQIDCQNHKLQWEAFKAGIGADVSRGVTHGFIFIHGFALTFDRAIETTAQIWHDLMRGTNGQPGIDTIPFLFTWPSLRSTANWRSHYSQAQGNKTASMVHFERFVAKVCDEMAQYVVRHLPFPVRFSLQNPSW